MKIHGLIKR